MIDFTNFPRDLITTYGGSDRKRGIIYEGKRYMLKFSDRIQSDQRNSLCESYSNSVISEYLCCHLIELCGYPVQQTLLGQVWVETVHHPGEYVPVVACKNFIPSGFNLIEFKYLQLALADEVKPGRTPKLEELYDILGDENPYMGKEFCSLALRRYWDTFIFDAIFGNFDRHGGNWGYLINKETMELSLAPIYDCGSCLYPQLDDTAIEGILTDEKAVLQRVNTFPNAALLKNGKKINYKEFLTSLENQDCTNALLRVYPLIDLDKINQFIDTMEGISEVRKEFYKLMIEKRYDLILTVAYRKAVNC